MDYFKLSPAHQRIVALLFTKQHQIAYVENDRAKTWTEDSKYKKRQPVKRLALETLLKEGWVQQIGSRVEEKETILQLSLTQQALEYLRYLVTNNKLKVR